ncbi:LWamide neuropeptides [Tetranychus urticae]|uniref:Uncharacterized protein n=1 Tax=Tetranychus urticae TaxID=32264 RepID=T1KEW0_TETUR|nr:LWamide neuropeptides [Tetranychus urticae]
MVKSSEVCCYFQINLLLLLTIWSVSLISSVSLAPESVTNLDQYATDPDSIGTASHLSLPTSSSSSSLLGQQHKGNKITVYYPNMESQDFFVDDLEDNQIMEKKGASWNKLQGAWGKRASDSWNKLSGGWGKRGPGDRDWNQLSGMWGKRSSSGSPSTSAQWNHLSGMWGKRGWNDLSGQWGKRDSPHWNNLRGMWG